MNNRSARRSNRAPRADTFTLPKLQTLCDEWNQRYPIGTEVLYSPVIGESSGRRTKTRSAAYVLSGHTCVIFIENQSGCVALEAVKVITCEGANQ